MKTRKLYVIIFLAAIAIFIYSGSQIGACQHQKTITAQINENTCDKMRKTEEICVECNTVIRKAELEDCPGALVSSSSGEVNSIPMPGENSVYVPGTGIYSEMTVGSFTQDAVDKNEILYSEDTSRGEDDPFILGHDYKTLADLDLVKVGQPIYLSVDGEMKIYQVVLSEKGKQNADKTDIIAKESGISIWHNLGTETLHMYTCHGFDINARWMVLAELWENSNK